LELIDIGVNLTHPSFRPDLDHVVRRALAAGVAQMVVTGTTELASEAARELGERHPGVLYATAGVHPHDARHWGPRTASRLAEVAASDAVVAIGEAGLDFCRDFSPRPDQERVLEEQLELATDLGLPIFLHEREAHRRVVAILSRYRDRLRAAVLHCFTGSAEELAMCLDMDLHIGITGWICDERRGLHLCELVGRVPGDRLMLETDAPFLLPRDLEPKPKGRRNEPAFLPHVLDAVARYVGESAASVAERTTRTARSFFGLAQPAANPPPTSTTHDESGRS
jgi:TatD DNase family protein